MSTMHKAFFNLNIIPHMSFYLCYKKTLVKLDLNV